MRKHRITAAVLLAVTAACRAAHPNGTGVDASKCLATRVQVSEEIGNMFSRTISFQASGFDPLVRRVSGSGIYRILKVTPDQIVIDSSFLYDGNPVSTGETVVKDAGRTTCWKGDCSVATDASGVSINPLFWGSPKGKVHVGQSWEVTIPMPWELGPPGKQTIRVVTIDASTDTITLEREGEGEGDALNEIKKLPLVKDKQTHNVHVRLGKAKWSGYATFRRGIVVSDVLLVERPITITSPELGTSSGTERQFILLNRVPTDLLRK